MLIEKRRNIVKFDQENRNTRRPAAASLRLDPRPPVNRSAAHRLSRSRMGRIRNEIDALRETLETMTTALDDYSHAASLVKGDAALCGIEEEAWEATRENLFAVRQEVTRLLRSVGGEVEEKNG